jgi:hypothetical protein
MEKIEFIEKAFLILNYEMEQLMREMEKEVAANE